MNNDIEMIFYSKNPSFISPNGTPPNLPTLFFIEEDLFYMNNDIEMISYSKNPSLDPAQSADPIFNSGRPLLQD